MTLMLPAGGGVVVQGITGRESRFWTERMLSAGARIVAGVTPGKEGEVVHGVPVYHTVQRARRRHPAEVAVILVPAAFAKEAALEALEAGMQLVVWLTDGVPVQDVMAVVGEARARRASVVGPNTPGLAVPGHTMLGFVPVWLDQVWRPGCVGLMSRSGTLSNEVASHIVAAGYGVSTFVGCGGDPVVGTRFVDLLPQFEQDPATRAVVLVGEVGGSMEEEAAGWILRRGYAKPVVAYIAGRTAPEGKRMGHAGAIIAGSTGKAVSKEEVLRAAGVQVAEVPAAVGGLLQGVLQ
ncbi:MAG TPA: succinate--CoA ligase subunit alpha [Clostridiales bacterium UBA8153]|nr:succinate--CoA ligase subunit alpha [Clostridiales bacterium UBA8153]